LEQFGIDPRHLKIINLPPNGIAAAWERGDIDAAFGRDPALSKIKRTGKVLITSGIPNPGGAGLIIAGFVSNP
jgi:taurine transport system substrate-binding protein